MAKHTVSTQDFINFRNSVQIAGAFGNGENKSLNIVTQIANTGAPPKDVKINYCKER